MYVISSTEFDTKREAIEQLEEWGEAGDLDNDARVYKVSKSYMPIVEIDLVEFEN